MFVVGLTGGIGSGKSTVSQMLTELDVPVIDADLAARQVVKPGRKAWQKIRQLFGDEILESDGEINRKKLGEIIFSDPILRKKLNAITHPQIAKDIAWDIIKCFFKGYQFVVIDSPLLFEANTWVNLVHKIIVVSCKEEIQLTRLMARNNFTKEEAMSRISAQMPLEEKIKKADYIIENSKDLDETREQVVKIFRDLRKSKAHWKVRIAFAAITISFTAFIAIMLNQFM